MQASYRDAGCGWPQVERCLRCGYGHIVPRRLVNIWSSGCVPLFSPAGDRLVVVMVCMYVCSRDVSGQQTAHHQDRGAKMFCFMGGAKHMQERDASVSN